jgi:hypothetical protein
MASRMAPRPSRARSHSHFPLSISQNADFFPEPLPDELLYSLVARYAAMSGLPAASVLKDLVRQHPPSRQRPSIRSQPLRREP